MELNVSEQATEQRAAEHVVREYMRLLQAGDTDGIMNLYGDDAVFLPAGAPTFSGKSAIRDAYALNFTMMDVVSADSSLEEATIHGDIALVRLATRSTVVMLPANDRVEVNARELFILSKVDGEFKISRYMFNAAN